MCCKCRKKKLFLDRKFHFETRKLDDRKENVYYIELNSKRNKICENSISIW